MTETNDRALLRRTLIARARRTNRNHHIPISLRQGSPPVTICTEGNPALTPASDYLYR
jgi:hypothetical protein